MARSSHNIKDELSEVLCIKNPKVFVIEWLPFDSNQLRELNKKLDIEKGAHKTLLTGIIDRSPDVPIFTSTGKHTKVLVNDYILDSFVNLEAVIDLPEEEGVVQIEEMAIFISKSGFIVYSLDLDEIEGQNSFMSLDKLSRVVADLSQDSSMVIDSLLTEFQRNFIKIIFGNPMHRPKTICYIGEEINIKHNNIAEYYDGEDCEIEINQLLGEGHKPHQVGSNLFFKGSRGTLAIFDDFTEESEYQLTFWGIQHAISNFVDCFMSRIWELYDQSDNIKLLVEEAAKGNTDALNSVQEQITLLSSTISLVSQIQEFLKDSTFDLLKIYKENNISNLIDFYEADKGLETSRDRVKDANKIINGLLTELDGIRNYIATLSELQMRNMSKTMTRNTKSMNQVLQANTRTGEAIDMIELILAGSIILEVFAFAVGEYGATDTIFGGVMNKYGTLIMFIISIVCWIAIVVYLRWSKSRMELKALKDFVITMSLNRSINVENLDNYMSEKEILTKYVEYDKDNTITTFVWDISNDPDLKDLDVDHLSITYNETSSLLLSIEIETSNVETNQKEMIELILNDMKNSGVVDD
ncbi:MAG: hypothetical protein GPJ51_08065 [Candidatus Heimdallarchaeota archaeon]|nr:hypothetical protein [Candidatus Heimdallarchaeota archaeon]